MGNGWIGFRRDSHTGALCEGSVILVVSVFDVIPRYLARRGRRLFGVEHDYDLGWKHGTAGYYWPGVYVRCSGGMMGWGYFH